MLPFRATLLPEGVLWLSPTLRGGLRVLTLGEERVEICEKKGGTYYSIILIIPPFAFFVTAASLPLSC